MPRTISYEVIEKLFESQGYKLLDRTEYVTGASPLSYRCPVGHVHKISATNFKVGKRCRQCGFISSAASKRRSIEEIRRLFDAANCKLVSTSYKNTSQILEYICPKGHNARTSYSNFSQGKRCGFCAGKGVDIYEAVKQLFEAEGYKLISESVETKKAPLLGECPKGHKIKTSWEHFVSRGQRCRICYLSSNFSATRLSIKHAREEFEKRGFRLISDEYINNSAPLEYECSQGHLSKICLSSLKSGKGCMQCAGRNPLLFSEVIEQAERNNYQLLTTELEYKNSESRISVICDKGHLYSVTSHRFARLKRKCRQCLFDRRRGANHPGWNQNLTKEERIIKRNFPEYTIWVNGVFKRDCYTCQICSQRGGSLVAHHIFNYADHPELRVNLENGITLCKRCHKAFHSAFGVRMTNLEQLQSFSRSRVGREIGDINGKEVAVVGAPDSRGDTLVSRGY